MTSYMEKKMQDSIETYTKAFRQFNVSVRRVAHILGLDSLQIWYMETQIDLSRIILISQALVSPS